MFGFYIVFCVALYFFAQRDEAVDIEVDRGVSKAANIIMTILSLLNIVMLFSAALDNYHAFTGSFRPAAICIGWTIYTYYYKPSKISLWKMTMKVVAYFILTFTVFLVPLDEIDYQTYDDLMILFIMFMGFISLLLLFFAQSGKSEGTAEMKENSLSTEHIDKTEALPEENASLLELEKLEPEKEQEKTETVSSAVFSVYLDRIKRKYFSIITVYYLYALWFVVNVILWAIGGSSDRAEKFLFPFESPRGTSRFETIRYYDSKEFLLYTIAIPAFIYLIYIGVRYFFKKDENHV